MSQAQRILEYIHEHGSITDAEARACCGCTRVAARIKDLRDAHVPINSEMIKVRTRDGYTYVARYSLAREYA